MFTWRTLHLSRVAMLSTFAFASSTSSLSQRRPRAMDAIKVARVSDRIGPAAQFAEKKVLTLDIACEKAAAAASENRRGSNGYFTFGSLLPV
jgi:hypothetical protein